MSNKHKHLDMFEQFDREQLEARSGAIRKVIQAFEKVIADHIAEYDNNYPPDEKIWSDPFDVHVMTHHYTVLNMLQRILSRLEDFGPSCYDFFYYGFFDETQKKYVKRNENVPPRSVLGHVLHSISEDLNIIQKSTWQRRFDKTGLTPELLVLGTADRLAAGILAQTNDNGILDTHHHFISHLTPLSGVRLIPYWNVILFGLPFSALTSYDTDTRKDFLIIPHEIGHLIYWLGESPGEGNRYLFDYIDDRLSAAGVGHDDWRRNWVEELAADLFGLLVAGPVAALEFQYLVSDDSPSHFMNDTSKHPIPVLRPLFLVRLLEKIGKNGEQRLYVNAPDILRANWKKWVQANRSKDGDPFDPKTTYKVHDAPNEMTAQQILNDCDVVLDILIEALGANYDAGKNELARKWEPWTNDLPSADSKVFELYEMYEEYDLDMDTVPTEQHIEDAGKLENQIAYTIFYTLLGYDEDRDGSLSTAEKLKAWRALQENNTMEIDYDLWRYLVFMPSWSSEGPEKPRMGTEGTGTGAGSYTSSP